MAVEFEGRRLTYAELEARSNRLAHHLRTLGVGPDVHVALCVDRSLDTVVGLLGILKAGGAYVPLDPAYPAARLAYMLKDSRAQVLVTEADLLTSLPEHGARVVCLDSDRDVIARGPDGRPDNAASGPDLAYVMYTSGSTGRPKGVEILHRAVVNLLGSMREEPGLSAGDRLLAVTSLSFDMSVVDIFLPLIVGARIVLVGRSTAFDGARLARSLAETGTTVMQATPATWRLLLEAGWSGHPDLRILCGGETLTRELAERLLPCGRELWNLYGPTEATVFATVQRVRAGRREVSIGSPIANTVIHVLDEWGRPVSADSPGEIHIGGAGLARGYLNRPELTAERFIPHPFDRAPGARLYRTGDLGRYRADGSLEHLGRMDHQVKVRGFRIELGEIEAQLERHPSVRQAIVVAREERLGDKRLVAYLSVAAGQAIGSGDLRKRLREELPDYMIPRNFVHLDRFPLTPNGKVDRDALLAAGLPGPSPAQTQNAPRTENEERLARICAEVLRVERVGREDDFFDLGGDSIKLAQIAARVSEAFPVELPLRLLFEEPTIAGLLPFVESAPGQQGSATQVPMRAASRPDRLPLSFSQERVWFVHQLNPENLAYNFQSTIRFWGPLDTRALERSLNEIVRRHEIYRTTFPVRDDHPVQVIHPHAAWSLPVVDLSGVSENERDAVAREWYEREFQRRFDITRLPLARWTVLKYGQGDHVLVHVEHHLVHDGWSFNVFLRELVEIYSSFVAGQASPLPELPIQFADFAAGQRRWMQDEVAQAQLDYWKRRLADMPALLEVPADRPRPKSQSFRGAAPRAEVPLALCTSLRALGRSRKATFFQTTLTGFLALLHRYTRRSDLAVGTFFANRRSRESESLIGMIINNAVIRASLASDPTVAELLGQVRDLVLEGANRQDVPFDRVVSAVGPRRDPSYNPLFQVAFSFHDEPMPERGPAGIDVEVTPVVSNGSAKFDLSVIGVPHSAQRLGLRQGTDADGLTMIWEYSTSLFDAETIQRMIADYENLLGAMVADPGRRISELALDAGRPRSPAAFARPRPLPLEPTSEGTWQEPDAGYTAPRDPVEQRLAAIWSDVLDVEDIGIHDDFFSIGGHSLLAVRLFARIEEEFGKRLPLATILEASTVEELAIPLRESRQPSWSSLVPIQPRGSKPPLYCIHALEGNVLFYRDLARHLGEDQPVYGLQAVGLDGATAPLSSVEAMAAHFLDEIRTVQPNGPYSLGGHCLGAAVALEMAIQLRAKGEEVALLASINTDGEWRSVESFGDGIHYHLRHLSQLGSREKLRYLTERIRYRTGRVFVPMVARACGRLAESGRPIPLALRGWFIHNAHRKANSSYVPGVFEGRLVFFQGTGNPHLDPHGFWGRVISDGIEIVEVPGRGEEVLAEPHVRVLAERLRERLI